MAGDWMYDGVVRRGSSDIDLMSRRRGVEEKARFCAGTARSRGHGRGRCCSTRMLRALSVGSRGLERASVRGRAQSLTRGEWAPYDQTAAGRAVDGSRQRVAGEAMGTAAAARFELQRRQSASDGWRRSRAGCGRRVKGVGWALDGRWMGVGVGVGVGLASATREQGIPVERREGYLLAGAGASASASVMMADGMRRIGSSVFQSAPKTPWTHAAA